MLEITYLLSPAHTLRGQETAAGLLPFEVSMCCRKIVSFSCVESVSYLVSRTPFKRIIYPCGKWSHLQGVIVFKELISDGLPLQGMNFVNAWHTTGKKGNLYTCLRIERQLFC